MGQRSYRYRRSQSLDPCHWSAAGAHMTKEPAGARLRNARYERTSLAPTRAANWREQCERPIVTGAGAQWRN